MMSMVRVVTQRRRTNATTAGGSRDADLFKYWGDLVDYVHSQPHCFPLDACSRVACTTFAVAPVLRYFSCNLPTRRLASIPMPSTQSTWKSGTSGQSRAE